MLSHQFSQNRVMTAGGKPACRGPQSSGLVVGRLVWPARRQVMLQHSGPCCRHRSGVAVGLCCDSRNLIQQLAWQLDDVMCDNDPCAWSLKLWALQGNRHNASTRRHLQMPQALEASHLKLCLLINVFLGRGTNNVGENGHGPATPRKEAGRESRDLKRPESQRRVNVITPY